MAKQTTITIETRSLVILNVRHSRRAWCARCAAERETLAIEDAQSIAGPAVDALEEWLDAGDVHRCSGSEGSRLICLSSLLARIRTEKERT